MRGIFNKRPFWAEYKCMWDVYVELEFLKVLVPVHTITLRFLTLNTLCY